MTPARPDPSFLSLYRYQIERWQHLLPEKYIAPMGVRLFAIRCLVTMGMGYDDFVRQVSCNVPAARDRIRSELQLRHDHLCWLMHEFDEPLADIEEVTRLLDEELAAADSDDGQRRLRAFLERMVWRYWLLEQHTERKLSS